MSLPCVLRLPLFWPSLGFLTTFLFFPPGASVESQFLRDGAESLLSGFSYILSHGSLLVHFSLCISRLLRFLLPYLGVSVSVCFGGFPCSFFTSLSCRLAFPAPLILFLFLFLRLSLSHLGVFQLILFPLFFLVFSSHPVAVHLSAFILIDYVFFLLLGRDSGKFSRLPPQVFSFSSSSPLRPLRLASSSVPAGPLCPGDTIAYLLPYRLRYEPVVMVWSAYSHIGQCSCGDSRFIVWSALSLRWLSGCSAASHLVGRLDGWPQAGDIDASLGQSR